MPPTKNDQPIAHAAPSAPENPSTLVWIFRIVRWSTYLAAFVSLILILHKTPPPPVQTSPQAAARAEEKFQEAQRSVAQGQPTTMRMDSSELSSYLTSHLDLPGAAALASNNNAPSGSSESSGDEIEQMRSNVRDVKVDMIEDRVRAYVVFNVHGKDMTLQLEGHLSSENGYLHFEPISGQLGSMPIPVSALQSAVQKMMDSPENREKLKLPADVSGLQIQNGEVVTSYK